MILIAEPTRMIPVRGHRAHIGFTAVATGVQAHSSTGKGHNANWDLVEFLAEMKAIYTKLRQDPALQDTAYDPVFSDFNLIIDNHGTAVNVTVPTATVQIKFRYSARIDPAPIVDAVRQAAARAGLALTETREGNPPELPAGPSLCAPRRRPARHASHDRAVRHPTHPCCRPSRPASCSAPATLGLRTSRARPSQWHDLEAAIPVFASLAERVAAASA